MQNVQNAAEIQQRVINLVELYRTKVGKESKIAKDAKADYEARQNWNEEIAKEALKKAFTWPILEMHGPDTHTEIWTKGLQVNEQLLGHFYAEVAKEDSDKECLDQLLPDVYDKTVFNEEEESFLKAHFKEMVNYIILTPCDDSLEWVSQRDRKDISTIPIEVLELIKSRVEIATGSKVYYYKTLFGQLANLFDGCTYYCDTMSYAWTKIAVYANGIEAVDIETVDNNPSSFDAVVSYLPYIDYIWGLCEAYKKLSIGGKLVLLCPPSILSKKNDANVQFRKMLVEDKSIKEIIQLPQVMRISPVFESFCLLIVEKGRSENDVLLIDARTASNDFVTKHYMLSFDNLKFNAILQNSGIDPNSGLRKMIKVSADSLLQELLLPQVYTIERPLETEHPVPLSNLCTFESTLVRDVGYKLPDTTPMITLGDLEPLFSGDLDMSTIWKANAFVFDDHGNLIDSSIAHRIAEGYHFFNYSDCTFFDGNSDAVLYDYSSHDGVCVAIVRGTGKPYIVSQDILVFCPKKNFDANSLAAVLRLPITYRQLIAYQEYGIGDHLDDILVPTDKRVIGDELYRMKKEKDIIGALKEKLSNMEKS